MDEAIEQLRASRPGIAILVTGDGRKAIRFHYVTAVTILDGTMLTAQEFGAPGPELVWAVVAGLDEAMRNYIRE